MNGQRHDAEHGALVAVVTPLLPLDFEQHESASIKEAARLDRAMLARRIADALIAAGYRAIPPAEGDA